MMDEKLCCNESAKFLYGNSFASRKHILTIRPQNTFAWPKENGLGINRQNYVYSFVVRQFKIPLY